MKNLKIILIVVIVVGIAGGVFKWSAKNDEKVMSIHYCFAEQMDGSLYHYECDNTAK